MMLYYAIHIYYIHYTNYTIYNTYIYTIHIGIDCDISSTNPLALRNTELLQLYSVADPRVKQVGSRRIIIIIISIL
jgi:DNA polymerase sigma